MLTRTLRSDAGLFAQLLVPGLVFLGSMTLKDWLGAALTEK
ncbi:TPA: hypothetical protein ACGO11_000263 [Streptococcus suis]